MNRRGALIGAALALVLVVLVVLVVGPGSEPADRPTPRVTFALVLRQPGRPLDGFLRALYTPGTRSYRRYISATSFGERFGLHSTALAGLRATLARAGIRILHAYPQRTALDVSAAPGVAARLFGLRVHDGTGRAPVFSGQAVIPPALRRWVRAVAGLGAAAPALPDDILATGLRPSDAASAYDVTPLTRLGLAGQGETVAIVSFAGYSQSDLDHFTQGFGLPPLHPQSIAVDGGTTDTNPSDESEVELDLEIIHEIAPQAQILDYNAPQSTSSGGDPLGDVIDRIVADGRARIVSDSWGACELLTPTSDIQRDEAAIEAAVAHGVSIFKAAGDAGAYQCQRSNSGDHRLSVEWPTSSPGVIAVGGTALAIGTGGVYAGETTWQDPLEQGGGGGGLSAYFRRPAWQTAPGVVNGYSNGAREIPDIAADADVATGWATVTGGSAGITGGTSAASPFWAALTALFDEDVRRHGLRPLGFIDPMLYAIASSPQPAPPFHDITVGTNRYYPATPGWDFATGLGSPDAANLARDVIAYLRRTGG